MLGYSNRTRSSNLLKTALLVFTSIITLCKAQLDNLLDRFPTVLTQNKDNSFNTPLNELFWASMNPETKYTLSKETFGTFVTPTTVVETNGDIEKYNFNKIDITKRLNETSFVAVFEGNEMAVQHVNGTGNQKIEFFERQIFNTEGINLQCQDIYPIQFYEPSLLLMINRMYLLCDPADVTQTKTSFIFQIVDGSKIEGPFKYDITTLNGRSRVTVVSGTNNKVASKLLLQFDGTFWDAQRSNINLRVFTLNTALQIDKLAGLKTYSFPRMSKVFNIYPRGNNVLVYGIYKSDAMESSKVDQFSDKIGKQVLLQCLFDLDLGFTNCDTMISYSDTSMYLGFDQFGNHLDIYTEQITGNIIARNYILNQNVYTPAQGKAEDAAFDFADFVFDSAAMLKILDTNYIWDFDVTTSGLRIRFNDKVTNQFSQDMINYIKTAGNDPTGKEVLGYITSDMSEVQDNWVYSVQTKIISRFDNSPSYLKISPQVFDKDQIEITANQGTANTKVSVDYGSFQDLFKVTPVLPDIPDFRISQNTISSFSIPRGDTAGNGLKFSITSTGPVEYIPTVFNNQKYTWTLTNPVPAKWTPFYSYGTNILALIHQETTGYILTYYVCPPVGSASINNCIGLINVNVPYTPTAQKPYILPKPITLSGARDYFITVETDDSYKLNFLNVTYDAKTKKFSGSLSSIVMPDVSKCNDYISISNAGDSDGQFLCSMTPVGGNGYVQAWGLQQDGKQQLSKIVRAEWQDITYKDVNGKFCPYQIRKSGKIGEGLVIYSNCPKFTPEKGTITGGEEYFIVLGSSPQSFTTNTGLEQQRFVKKALKSNHDLLKYEQLNYEGFENPQQGTVRRLLSRASKSFKNLFLTEKNENEHSVNDDPTITRYSKFYVLKTYHPQLFDDQQGPGYDFCSLKSQYIITRPGSTTFSSYDVTFSSVKTFSASELGWASISGLACDTVSDALVIFGIDTQTVTQYAVFRGSSDRNMDDRSILYISTRKIGTDNPRVFNIAGNLVINNNPIVPITVDSETVNVKNVLVTMNTKAIKPPPAPSSSAFTVTVKTADSTLSDAKTGKLDVVNIDHTLTVKSKTTALTDIGEGGIFFIDKLVSVDGPLAYTSMSSSSDHIQLSPRIVREKANFLLYNNAKSHYDLQIMTITGGVTYDVYSNYNTLYRAIVPVGANIASGPALVQDVDIIYIDGKRTDFAGFAVFFDGQGDCYLSKYDSEFKNELIYQLRNDGSCYSYLKVAKNINSNQIFIYLKDNSRSELHTFIIDITNWTMKYPRAVRIQNIDAFDVIVQDADQVQENGYKAEVNMISVIAKSGTSFTQLDFTTSIHPTVKAFDIGYKFYSNTVKCNVKNQLCVSSSQNNLLYGFYPFQQDQTTKKIKVVLFEKYDNYIDTVIGNANIAVGKEFVGYLGIKSGVNSDQASVSVNVSVILYDVRTDPVNLSNYKAMQMITVQNFTRDPVFFTSPFGYINLLDIEVSDQFTQDTAGEPNINLKTVLSYNDGGSIFNKIRGDLYFNFTKGFHRDDTSSLGINFVGVDPNTEDLVVKSIMLNTIFDLDVQALKWYYWVLIIGGGGLILTIFIALVFGKDKKDAVLDDEEDYSVVEKKETDEDQFGQSDDGLGFGTGLGSGFLAGGGNPDKKKPLEK